MIEQLKQCPFCGGPANSWDDGDGKPRVVAHCDKCGCCADIDIWNSRQQVGYTWFEAHGDNRPPENEKFLSCNMNQGGIMAVTWWDNVHNRWKATGGQTYYQFTHWTHLPNKPRVVRKVSDQPADGF